MKKCFVMVLLCCLLVAGTAFAKTGTLLVAFGTSMDSARPAIDDIEKAYKKAAGNEPVLLAFTSDIIRNKLAKEGKPVLSVNAAMNELAAQGVTDLKIQSLHIAPAEEYNQLERMVVKNITKNPGVFKTVKVGYPLLVSEKDRSSSITPTQSGKGISPVRKRCLFLYDVNRLKQRGFHPSPFPMHC